MSAKWTSWCHHVGAGEGGMQVELLACDVLAVTGCDDWDLNKGHVGGAHFR